MMLKSIEIKNVGPVELNVDFGPRLNIFTGDNGLGKSFLLDAIWFALTQKWPTETNPNLTSGFIGLPKAVTKPSEIAFKFIQNGKEHSCKTVFNRERQNWDRITDDNRYSSEQNKSLVIYALADGSFCVWDPVRASYFENSSLLQKKSSAFAFTSQDIWNGLKENDKYIINGLIADICSWQDKKSLEFDCLTKLLKELSPTDYTLSIGKQTRLSLNDVRNIPTIKMPYGSVPAPHISSAIKRILSIAYCITWAFSEHKKACSFVGQKQAAQITFLIDEIESHLHPSWQKKIMRALETSIDTLLKEEKGKAQIIATTHSPLVMVSLEDFFNSNEDKWFDFDAEKRGTIHFSEREFKKYGTSDSWLQTQAFDMDGTRSIDSTKLIKNVYKELGKDSVNNKKILSLYSSLLKKLSPTDDELFLIRYACQKKGIIK